MSDKISYHNATSNSSVPLENLKLVDLSPEQHSILCVEQDHLFAISNQTIMDQEQNEILEQIRLSNTVDVEEQYRILNQIRKQQHIVSSPSDTTTDPETSHDESDCAEEQRRIIEQIQLEKRVGSGGQRDVQERNQISYLSEQREKKHNHIESTNYPVANGDLSPRKSKFIATSTDLKTSQDENDCAEEQRRILEQIQLKKRVGSEGQRDVLKRNQISYSSEQREKKHNHTENTNCPDANGDSSPSKSNFNAASMSLKMLQPCAAVLKSGHLVPLHGPEVTRQAIAEGKAATIQCLQCMTWLQIKQDATLMFCPSCSRLSPVIIPETKVDINPEKVYPVTSDAGKVNSTDIERSKENEQKMQGCGCLVCLERCVDQMFRLFGI